jgi:subtilisin family serine protease
MSAHVKPARFLATLLALALLAALGPVYLAARPDPAEKLDSVLKGNAKHRSGFSRVIVRIDPAHPKKEIAQLIRSLGGKLGRKLPSISSQVALVPNESLDDLVANPLVARVSLDRVVTGTMERTAATIGAAAVRQSLDVDGRGIGVAVIDSGVAEWHDDLSDNGVGQRVAEFVDFVDGTTAPFDDYGHGTHVAGVIAGNGRDSDGLRAGIAPGAHLVVLKVLDANGRGHISDVVAAIDYAIDRRDALNIRVLNLSVGAGVYESYQTDPLTQATLRAVRAGITVVAAAGNAGRRADGRTQYGGTMAPGNAPWVLTVGAFSHMGTVVRDDDTIASFSSRGPTAVDRLAKPDLVAPGVGIESLAVADSTLYASASNYLLPGTPTGEGRMPYLSLSGTSVAAPVVSGTIALMLQANPLLTPNAVKAILQYTAHVSAAYDPLTEGAGFVNAKGAVELARYLASPSQVAYPDTATWGARLIWGNRLVTGGRLAPEVNAWSTDVTWGSERTASGDRVVWGQLCKPDDCTSTTGKWRTGGGQNVVWGSLCSGADCNTEWTIAGVSSVSGSTVVWGTADDGETVVWGTTDDGETVVWGTADDGETVVWGTGCTVPNCTPIVWSRR